MARDIPLIALTLSVSLAGCAAPPPVSADDPVNAAVVIGMRQDRITPSFGAPYYDGSVTFGFWRLDDNGEIRLVRGAPQKFELGCDVADQAPCAQPLVFRSRTLPAGRYVLAYYFRHGGAANLAPSAQTYRKLIPCKGDDYRSSGGANWKVEAGKITYLGLFQVSHLSHRDLPQQVPTSEAEMSKLRETLRGQTDMTGEIVTAPPAPALQAFFENSCVNAQPPQIYAPVPGVSVGAPTHM